MAVKKSGTPVPETETEEMIPDKELELQRLREELAAQKAENEKLRMNSVAAYGAAGAKSDHERVQDACKKAAEEGADSWNIKISVRAPRRPSKEDPFYWLSVNGRTIQIPANDKYFELPLPFAACLTDMIAAEWLAADFSDSIENYDPVTNPKKD